MDKVSFDRLATLHPKFRPIAEAAYKEACEALTGRATLRIAFGTRTWDQQRALYAQGRTKPGKVVTNAPAGKSVHNYGLAVDIVLIIDGKTASWDTLKDFDGDKVADWMEVVRIFKKHGMEWGGDWKSFKDMPHFQMTFGLTVSEMERRHIGADMIPGKKWIRL